MFTYCQVLCQAKAGEKMAGMYNYVVFFEERKTYFT